MGQGLATALAQICAAELGVAPEDISVVAGDSSVVPVGLGGFASRQTVTAGNSFAWPRATSRRRRRRWRAC
jgi:carbon-monoxide dehydrogenase large subunit